jgi:clan AA aspartic protease (TIGR02281 family)
MQRDFSLSEFLKSHNYIGIQMDKNIVGHFEIDAHINGEQARLLIDTGASGTVVDRASVERFCLETAESKAKAGGIGTTQHAVEVGVVKSLDLGLMQVNQWRVAVIDLSHVSQSLIAHGGQEIHGVIGGDLMSKKSAIIDYPNAILYLLQD